MISKKSRKVIAAVLIGATVCASGTFAYFNSKLDMSKIANTDENTQTKLAITNGHVEITGKINGVTAGTLSSLWSYDVARVSTVNDLKSATDKAAYQKALGTTANILSTDSVSDGLVKLNNDTKYIVSHRSPDISEAIYDKGTGLTNTTKLTQGTCTSINGITQRAEIGTPLRGEAVYARPGDAFVFGNGAGTEAGVKDAGLDIWNKSNITTKLGIRLNATNSDTLKKQLDQMAAAGWKVYVKIDGLDVSTNTAGANKTTYTDYIELDVAKLASGETFELIPLSAGTALTPVTADEEGKFTGVKIQLRVELPLLTGNNKQDKDTTNDGAEEFGALNILDLFEVVATQENNPGWTQAGTTPAADQKFTNTDDTTGQVFDSDVDVADPTKTN
ncbi:MAG: hypothetical protein SOY42_09960 [Clostridium sp.]|nr:hypothetical protein [Clostridium sp.]